MYQQSITALTTPIREQQPTSVRNNNIPGHHNGTPTTGLLTSGIYTGQIALNVGGQQPEQMSYNNGPAAGAVNILLEQHSWLWITAPVLYVGIACRNGRNHSNNVLNIFCN